MITQLIPQEAQKIIVAPLNWGLGHAARSIPIISELNAAGKEVIIASDGEALTLLRNEFPQLAWKTLPNYNVQYKQESLALILISNASKVLRAIRAEAKACEAIVNETAADLIISDSRFGFRSPQVPSIIISHQLKPYSTNKLLSAILELGNRYLLNCFDECWVPDDVSHTLSGTLSQNPRINNAKHIGVLSRMQKPIEEPEKIFDLSIILSGPEPARTKLEDSLVSLLQASSKRICLIRGTQQKSRQPLPLKWQIIDLANSDLVQTTLLQSRNILSRSGYTSIMDYYSLGLGAFLIPTPGQSEQEYLAEFLDGQYGFIHIKDLHKLTELI